MNVVEDVVMRFGGQAVLAEHLELRPSAISYWVKVGTIPSKWHARLITLARVQGIALTAMDLIPTPSADLELTNPHGLSVTPRSNQKAIAPVGINQKKLPVAKWQGILSFGDIQVPVYVLGNGERIISRTGAADVLTNRQGGGNLESYIEVKALSAYMPSDLSGQMREFELEQVVNKTVMGMTENTFLEICMAYVNAFRANALETDRQKEIALQAAFILAACAKVGLAALIDEATGYQYVREEDALQVKLRLYLTEEMRKWEKTFPDALWDQFGRLTNWKGSAHQRPKYWGKLVTELVYEYLDPDVSQWLKDNAPKPVHGKNYHQWLTEQYGLKKLMEHLWMLVGMASACSSMNELRRRMGEKYGRRPVQMTLYIPDEPGPASDKQRRTRKNSAGLLPDTSSISV